MRCECGHSETFHDKECEEAIEVRPAGHGHSDDLAEYEPCPCKAFKLDPNWEPLSPPGWEGGFADNH